MSPHGFDTSWLLKPAVWRNLLHNTELGFKKSNIPPVTASEMRTVISSQRKQRLALLPTNSINSAQKDTANSEFKLLNSENVWAFSPLLVSRKRNNLHTRMRLNADQVRQLTSTGPCSPDLWLLWTHRFTRSTGKLLFIPQILPNHRRCQGAFKVCLLKPQWVQQEKSFLQEFFDSQKENKAHLEEKINWSCRGEWHYKRHRHSAVLTGTQTPRTGLSPSARTEQLDFLES